MKTKTAKHHEQTFTIPVIARGGIMREVECDFEDATEFQRARFRSMSEGARAKARRKQKRSTERRASNLNWYRAQRREDVNGQIIL